MSPLRGICGEGMDVKYKKLFQKAEYNKYCTYKNKFKKYLNYK